MNRIETLFFSFKKLNMVVVKNIRYLQYIVRGGSKTRMSLDTLEVKDVE